MDLNLEVMNRRRKEGKYCDFTIIADGKEFPVHRLVLDTCSEYFRVLFAAEMREKHEKCSEQKDATAVGVERAICCMYGEKFVMDQETVAEALQVCHRWQLWPAVKMCEVFLIENLGMDTCVMATKLATLYGMKKLGSKSTDFILNNLKSFIDHDETADLKMEEVQKIMITTKSISSFQLWEFCLKWATKQEHSSAVCRILRMFPASKYKSIMLDGCVWRNVHVKECDGCEELFANLTLGSTTREHINYENCIFVKNLARRFNNRGVEKMSDDFIVNHEDIFDHPQFHEIHEDDIVKYVRMIERPCSEQEFSALVRWMRHSPEHERIFPELFSQFDTSAKTRFSIDVRAFERRNIFTLFGLRNWLCDVKDCFFLKKLAKKYRCIEAQNMIDCFIISEFDEISKMPEFKELKLDEVKKYIKAAQQSESNLWNAAMIWVTHNLEERRQHFSELLQSLPFDRFSSSFIENTVLKSDLVQGSESYLLRIVLSRMRKMEKDISDLFKRMSKLEQSKK